MNLTYYRMMLKRKRLVPIYRNCRMIGFITFYICNDTAKYIDCDPWKPMEDNSQGKICYITQLFTDKNEHNSKRSYKVWNNFKNHIKTVFPSVESICWRRWDRENNEVKEYSKSLNRREKCLS